MSINKLNFLIKTSVFMVLLSIIPVAHAEYYVVSSSCPACENVCYSSSCAPRCAYVKRDYKCERFYSYKSYKGERMKSFKGEPVRDFSHYCVYRCAAYGAFEGPEDYNFDGRTADDVGADMDIDY